jgi:outer membrane protein OmpA-like peptidoglycan-associated protein
MRQTVRVNGLLLIVLMLIGLTACGSGGAKKDIETDASMETDAIVDEPDVNAPPQPAEEATIEDVIDHYMDQQAGELSTIEGAKTVRLNETILMTWDNNILFGFDSAMLKTDAQSRIERMADVFQRYPDTRIIVAGHTDSQGDEDYNFTLSERRALSVRNYLIDAGVPPERIETVGFGEFRPVTTNDTEEGRNANRRVEIEIHPNEKLKSSTADADSTH